MSSPRATRPLAMDLDQLLSDQPKLHIDGAGFATSWGVNEQVLRFIANNVSESSATLETGEGISTVLFAIKQTHHTCVTPNEPAVDRIKGYCADHGLSTERIQFEIDYSERVLPVLSATPLDLVLVDGGHGIPTPFIDWTYTADRLKIGGYLMLDDTQLWPVRVLRDFLAAESEWEQAADVGDRTAVFRKTAEAHRKEWPEQAFVQQMTDLLAINDHRRAVLERRQRALSLLRQGRLLTVARRSLRALRHH